MSGSTSSEPSDKVLDRSRLNYWVQHIAKILNKNQKKASSEDVHQIRFASNKLLQVLQQIEKSSKDAFAKHTISMDTLIAVLQVVTCEQTLGNVINIFLDLVGKQQPSKRASLLVNHGLTTVLFQILKLTHTNDIVLADDVLISIHTLLSRIGHKDRKFAVKARLHQSLMLTLNLVKAHSHNFRNLQPLLQVLKLYTSNSVNASYLGKHSAVNLMFKVISYCGKRHTVDLRLALENLCNLTKSKSNSARLIGMEGISQLLTLHSDWQMLDSKHRNLAIRRSILLILKNITSLRSGRKAFVEANGIRTLYESALEASDSRDMESLILLASVILRKCCPRNKLPLDSTLSPVIFPLPTSSIHTPECVRLANSSGEAESEHSSIDEEEEDDDIDSDDERFRTEPEEPDEDLQDGPDLNEGRTLEDLHTYDQFFAEATESEVNISKLSLIFYKTQFCTSSTATPLQRCHSGFLSSYQPSSSVDSPTMKHTVSDVNIHDKQKRLSIESSSAPNIFQQFLAEKGNQEEKSVSALNLKSGATIFSLDMGQRQNILSVKTSKSNSRSKQKKKLPASKDRRNSRKISVTHLDECLIDGLTAMRSMQVEDVDQVTFYDEFEDEFCEFPHDADLYTRLAAQTQSTHMFQKLAFPDLYGIKGLYKVMEPLSSRKFGVQRSKIFEDIDRMIHADQLVDRVVYDYDKIVLEQGGTCSGRASDVESNDTDQTGLSNQDELRLGFLDVHTESLKFSAQFECGNLRKAIQVRQYEYDLILNPDINSNHHHQWFYFEVSNMRQGQPYRFNIVNCEKVNSQFNFGMQPLMMSVIEALEGNPCWARVGKDICYYKNHFIRNANTTGGIQGKSYYTTTFTLTFPHAGDVCYLSYHYPYTYTALKTHLKQWEQHYNDNLIYFRNQSLCTTLGGNTVPLLTITAQPRRTDKEGLEELRSRPYIFLSGRVHPGESNASWVMKGTIDFLLSRKPQAQHVREMYIFKIVPMLNPDGVINGNHRSSLVGEDLNRRWGKPCPTLHPTIYHTKGLLQYLSAVNKTPLVYCDYHGHSRRKNIFMYGCSPHQSWISNDTQNPASGGNKINESYYKQLPRLLHTSCPSFAIQNCSFVVEKVKESTARVVVWREIGVLRSYTMESSYCGCDQGKYKDMHINTDMLEEMGHKFCETLAKLPRQKGRLDQQTSNIDPQSLFGATSEDYMDEIFGCNSTPLKKKDSQMNLDSDSDDGCELDEDEEFDDDTPDVQPLDF
ncbi:unnamed protein product [Lymnaea stagnalis]|uniref:tubulin-glutamate carboxypeptidase n=1 Tax=Lymnaea stagnalis TaxID=6523 RepID=A0AAV2H4C0_LYMST